MNFGCDRAQTHILLSYFRHNNMRVVLLLNKIYYRELPKLQIREIYFLMIFKLIVNQLCFNWDWVEKFSLVCFCGNKEHKDFSYENT